MAREHFPPTPRTWIDARLAEGAPGREAVNRHIMEIYRWPLEVYCRSLGLEGDPGDVVRGFFADRLGRDDFVVKWRASALPLRRWLINGMRYYLREEWARMVRDRDRRVELDDATAEGLSREAERAYVVSIVGQASREAQAACEAAGYGEHWRLFLAHVLDEEPFGSLGRRFGVDERRAAVMARTARNHFRRALRELLRRDGLPLDEAALDEEMRSIIGW
jgi:hypothetical protein